MWKSLVLQVKSKLDLKIVLPFNLIFFFAAPLQKAAHLCSEAHCPLAQALGAKTPRPIDTQEENPPTPSQGSTTPTPQVLPIQPPSFQRKFRHVCFEKFWRGIMDKSVSLLERDGIIFQP